MSRNDEDAMLTRADFNRALAGLPLLASGCGVQGEIAMPAAPSAENLAKAAARRVLFGHQSVGNNILDGVRAIAAEQNVSFNIVETRAAPADAGLYHFNVGDNQNPQGKITDFRRVAADNGADVALLKLCYVDFRTDTDAEALARDYVGALSELQQAHPGTRFIAATTPLTTLPAGPKEFVKRLIGRVNPAPAENAKRLVFNRIVRDRFSAATLFDIAALESGGTMTDGVEYMRPGLTDDGGHLNAQGQRIVAADLLRLLAA
jgi:hypothetical protein